MKKILTLVVCVILFQAANAAIIVSPIKANSIAIPIGSSGKTITMQELSTISLKQFEALTGKKMGFADRLMFKAAQKKLKKSISSDGTVNNKRIEKFLRRDYDGDDAGFNIGGFALGFFLGLVGVLIAYIINDDKNHSRRKWAWIGFGIFAVLYIALILIILSNAN